MVSSEGLLVGIESAPAFGPGETLPQSAREA